MEIDLYDEVVRLKQKNKNLKEKLDISEANYDIIYDCFTQVNELLGTELCEEVIDEILKLKKENKKLNNILNEFEEELKQIRLKLENRMTDNVTKFFLDKNATSFLLKYISKRLQKLKEDKK